MEEVQEWLWVLRQTEGRQALVLEVLGSKTWKILVEVEGWVGEHQQESGEEMWGA